MDRHRLRAVLAETQTNLGRLKSSIKPMYSASVTAASNALPRDSQAHHSSRMHGRGSQSPGNPRISELQQCKEAVANLQERLGALESERQQDRAELGKLRGYIGALEDRLRERGLDLETENKMALLQDSVNTRLRVLEQDARASHQESEASHLGTRAISAFSDDLRRIRQSFHAELDQLQADMAVLRTAQTRAAADQSRMQSDVQAAFRRGTELQDQVNKHNDQQRAESRGLQEAIDTCRSLIAAEVAAIRAELRHHVKDSEGSQPAASLQASDAVGDKHLAGSRPGAWLSTETRARRNLQLTSAQPSYGRAGRAVSGPTDDELRMLDELGELDV